MLKRFLSFIVLVAATFSHLTFANEANDVQIKQQIISQSIAAYSGSCACPYSQDRAGRNCGRRSAYSKPGGSRPLCYLDDVTAEMVRRQRERQR